MRVKEHSHKGYHYTADVWENDEGEYYVTVIPDHCMKLYRPKYFPKFSRMYYPAKWGKKKGVEILLDHLIESDEILIKKTAERLDKLKRCRDVVDNNWENDFISEVEPAEKYKNIKI